MINNVKRFLSFVLVIMLVGAFPPLCTADEIPSERMLSRLEDEGDLLSDSEEITLRALLDEISERQEFDVVVVTAVSLGSKTATEYADDFYDYNGYGHGPSRDGILMLICMEERDWAISTHGAGIPAFTDAGQEHIIDNVLPYLSELKFMPAFTEFANLCDEFITQHHVGAAYDIGNLPTVPKNWPKLITQIGLGSFVFGLVAALIAVNVMKGSLKSVAMQTKADNYVRNGSMNIRNGYENFLYNSVSRTAIPQYSSSSGGGGSSTHSSSSGSSHGGSSGKF